MSEPNILISVPETANYQLPDATLLNFYKDIEDRVYWLNSEIDDFTLDLVQYIMYWNKEDKDIPVEQRKPIKIIFNSPGGQLDVAETIVTMIRLSKTPIYGFAIGCVASAASLIYLSCHKRYALENSYFILHKGSCSNITGDYENVMAAMDDYREQVDRMVNFYIKNTCYSEEEVTTKIKKDWYVRQPESLEKGIVNEIITDIDILL